jgi:AraC family transcriptional regulator
VSAPFIAVVPACALRTLGSAADQQGLVIALDFRLLKETSRRVFGTVVREVPRWFKAWNPFLREAADTLAPLHRSRIANPACLDVFADVIAPHLVCHYGRRSDAHDSGTSLTAQKLTLVELFIHEHIAETIKVEQLATLVHMSPSHFARAFKKATGYILSSISPKCFIDIPARRHALSAFPRAEPATSWNGNGARSDSVNARMRRIPTRMRRNEKEARD